MQIKLSEGKHVSMQVTWLQQSGNTQDMLSLSQQNLICHNLNNQEERSQSGAANSDTTDEYTSFADRQDQMLPHYTGVGGFLWQKKM